MNKPPTDKPIDPTDSHAHLSNEEISAFVDGAVDVGAPNTDEGDRIVQHLAGCAQCSERRVELARTAAIVRTISVEPLDELTRQRMIDQALRAFETTGMGRGVGRWFAHPATVAIAAAAAAVFIAVGVISFDRPGDRSSKAKNDAASANASVGQFLGDIGEIGEPEQLRSAIANTATEAGALAAMTDSSAEPNGSSATPDNGASPFATPHAAAPTSSDNAEARSRIAGPADDADRDAARRCAHVTQLSIDTADDLIGDESDAEFSSELTFSAVGTHKGAAVVILVYTTKSGGQQIFVVAREDCTILSFLGTPSG